MQQDSEAPDFPGFRISKIILFFTNIKNAFIIICYNQVPRYPKIFFRFGFGVLSTKLRDVQFNYRQTGWIGTVEVNRDARLKPHVPIYCPDPPRLTVTQTSLKDHTECAVPQCSLQY